MRGSGHEKPTFLITNDLRSPVEVIMSLRTLAEGGGRLP